MLDQAASLRQLVRLAADGGPATERPATVAVCAAGQGAGATTVAVQLAITLGQQGDQVVLIDAAPNSDAARRCGVRGDGRLAEVLAARQELSDILQESHGVHVAAGCSQLPVDETSVARLLRQLDALGSRARWVVVDCGVAENALTRPFWQHASEIVLVATPATASLMDAYALVKSLGPSGGRIGLLINQASPQMAAGSFERVAASCQRFLKRPVELWGHLPAVEGPLTGGAALHDGLAAMIRELARQLKTGAEAGGTGNSA